MTKKPTIALAACAILVAMGAQLYRARTMGTQGGDYVARLMAWRVRDSAYVAQLSAWQLVVHTSNQHKQQALDSLRKRCRTQQATVPRHWVGSRVQSPTTVHTAGLLAAVPWRDEWAEVWYDIWTDGAMSTYGSVHGLYNGPARTRYRCGTNHALVYPGPEVHRKLVEERASYRTHHLGVAARRNAILQTWRHCHDSLDLCMPQRPAKPRSTARHTQTAQALTFAAGLALLAVLAPWWKRRTADQ